MSANHRKIMCKQNIPNQPATGEKSDWGLYMFVIYNKLFLIASMDCSRPWTGRFSFRKSVVKKVKDTKYIKYGYL